MKFYYKALIALAVTGTMVFTNVSMVLADTKTDILDARQEIKNITKEIKSGEEKISRLDNNLIELSVQIEENKVNHTQILEDIRVTGDEITVKTQQRDTKQVHLGKRLRSSYKSGDISWIKALMDSDNLSDFFIKSKVLKEIAQQDMTVIAELDAIKADLKATQVQLTGKEQEVTKLIGELNEQNKTLNTALADQNQNQADVTEKKSELAELVRGKEIELFGEIRDILTDSNSAISEINDARALLAQLEEFVETEDAEVLATQLDETSSGILVVLEAEKAAREAAQREAREAAQREAREAEERVAREAEVKAEARRAESERQAEAEEARRLRAAESTQAQPKVTKPTTTPAPAVAPRPAPTAAPRPAPAAAPRPVISSNPSLGAKVLAQAKTYLGVPYVYGGASYSGVDCSGFTMRAYAQAGISIPRTATAQYRASRRVSRSNLQPGDLIFWGFSGEITHVAIYVGNGMQIHAPRPGKSVCIVKMFGSMDYIAAGRPY